MANVKASRKAPFAARKNPHEIGLQTARITPGGASEHEI
jgi:hypothetical protein